jgi:hypothetical protein
MEVDDLDNRTMDIRLQVSPGTNRELLSLRIVPLVWEIAAIPILVAVRSVEFLPALMGMEHSLVWRKNRRSLNMWCEAPESSTAGMEEERLMRLIAVAIEAKAGCSCWEVDCWGCLEVVWCKEALFLVVLALFFSG